MSGSRVLLSGVGTAMEIASVSARRASSVVAWNLPLFTSAATSAAATSLDVGLAAHESATTRSLTSKPDHPACFREFDRERQTDVPRPITPTTALGPRSSLEDDPSWSTQRP
jgi:hypothetical protein